MSEDEEEEEHSKCNVLRWAEFQTPFESRDLNQTKVKKNLLLHVTNKQSHNSIDLTPVTLRVELQKWKYVCDNKVELIFINIQ